MSFNVEAQRDSPLQAELVEAIFLDCLSREGEDTAHRVEGVVRTVAFCQERLADHKHEILSMLAELPDAFKKTGGGGWTFLNACSDKNGRQWTGLHQRMEQLFQLGIGLGVVRSLLPREMWKALPGGMPYYVIE